MPITRERFLLAFGHSAEDVTARACQKVDAALTRLSRAASGLRATGVESGAFDAQHANLSREKVVATDSQEPAARKLELLANVESRVLAQAREAEAVLQQRMRSADPVELENHLRLTMEAGSGAVIDHMVGQLGDKVSSAQDREFIKVAMKARYNLDTVEGDMTSKALPKLYKLFGMVPSSHTTGNDSLKVLKRSDRLMDVFQGSYYRAQELVATPEQPGSPGKAVVINLPKSTVPFARKSQGPDRSLTRVEGFSLATLHEIGHSVDHKLGFMTGKNGQVAFGGWKTESVGSIADVALNDHNMAADFPTIRRSDLEAYLKAVLTNGSADATKFVGDIEDDAAVAQRNIDTLDRGLTNRDFLRYEVARDELSRRDADGRQWEEALEAAKKALPRLGDGNEYNTLARRILDKMFGPEHLPLAAAVQELKAPFQPLPVVPNGGMLRRLASHAAVAWCKSIRLSGGHKGLWGAGPSAAAAVAVRGRVYQQSYADSWSSYDLASRARGISGYQFRAPGEWFAELYAFYYLGKLPAAHADFGWIRDQIDQS